LFSDFGKEGEEGISRIAKINTIPSPYRSTRPEDLIYPFHIYDFQLGKRNNLANHAV
jgi:hypothetical protein